MLGWLFGGNDARCDGDTAREVIASGGQLVDVRSPAEFRGGSIEGAINIPVQELAARSGELDASRPVVLYCASGMRSAQAARALKAKGFEVHDLGSISRW